MLSPEVVLRFRDGQDSEPLYVGATNDLDLARAVAERLVAEAEAAAELASADDENLAALFRGEAARARAVVAVLGAPPLRVVPR